jgi:hypothetical protein
MESLLETKLLIFTVVLGLIVGIYAAATFVYQSYLTCRGQAEGGNDDDDDGDDDDDDGSSSSSSSSRFWIGSKSWWMASSLLVVSQLAEIAVAVVFWVRLAKNHRHHHHRHHAMSSSQGMPHHSHEEHHHALTEELWADRCHWLCQCLSMSTCCLFGGQELLFHDHASSSSSTSAASGGANIYEHVARALADYLETRGTLDVVPTDLVTGLLVLQRLQRQRILQARLQVVRSSQSQLGLQSISISQSISMQRGSRTTTTSSSLSSSSEEDDSMVRPVMATASPVSAPLPVNHHHRMPSSISSDIPTKHSPMTLRSRASSNDLRTTTSAFAMPNQTPPVVVARSASSSSSSSTGTSSLLSSTNRNGTASPPASLLDLPETTRLVDSLMTSGHTQQPSASDVSPPIHSQSIYRRCQITTTTTASSATPTTTNQQQQQSPPLRYYQPEPRAVLNPHNPVDCLRLQEGAQMAKYALAIYTWMLYVFVHPVTGLPRLLCRSCRLCCHHQDRHRRRRPPRRNSEDSLLQDTSSTSTTSTTTSTSNTTMGDNLCEWHKHSLLVVAGLPEADLVYAQFHNRLSLVPYCILLDHASQSVILSIRGSLSLEDLVTDVHIDPVSVDAVGQEFGFDADGQYCHAGVVACAHNVYNDLQRHGLLDQLLLVSSPQHQQHQHHQQQEYPNYHLRLVGHSLGAATCTLLGYMLQPRFPSLQVYNFSPPGCTMTWELATRCEAWTTTFVLDADIVPRLSVLALEELRDETLQLFGRLKVPKHQVVQSFWNGNSRRGCLYGTTTTTANDDDNNNSNHAHAAQDLEDLNQVIGDLLDETPQDTLYQRQLQEFLQVQEQRKQSRGNTRRLRLYPPGRMIHLLKTGEEGGCGPVLRKAVTCCTSNAGFRYTPVYIANDDLDEIVVSPTMGTDHFVDRMVDELSGLAQEYSGMRVGDGAFV